LPANARACTLAPVVISLESGCFYGQTQARSATPNLCFVLKRHDRGETTPLHSHEHPYLALVVRGAFRQFGRALEHACTPGTLALNTSGEEHHDRFEAERSEVINIQLPSAWPDALRAEGAEDPGYAWISRAGLLERARGLRAHLARPEPLSAFLLEGAAAELLGIAMRLGSARRRSGSPPSWLAEIEEAVRTRFRRPPPLAELAASVDRSPSQVVRTFRRWRGTTLGEFARRLRAEHARRALFETRASLLEIALDSGYSDQSHMTRELGTYLGSTPGRLRRARDGTRDRP
jgi:AraC family transcriptional regulator